MIDVDERCPIFMFSVRSAQMPDIPISVKVRGLERLLGIVDANGIHKSPHSQDGY